MGNCQAVDAAALVIQHPCGKIERLYWSVSASEVMRANPGHYVSLIMPLPQQGQNSNNNEEKKDVVFTRVKLLKPDDTLTLGHAYRLITAQGTCFFKGCICQSHKITVNSNFIMHSSVIVDNILN